MLMQKRYAANLMKRSVYANAQQHMWCMGINE